MTKRTYIAALLLLISSLAFSQVPQGIPYQAVVRNSLGNPITNNLVRFRFSIRDSSANGPILYSETDTVVTNQFGIINVVVGGGTIVQGTFGGINWGVHSKFMEVELDPTGGTNYTNMGTTQMLSVPYALYAGASPRQATPWDSLWITNGNNIYNTNAGNVGIQTDTPNAALTVNGYTMLGNDAPPIKIKEFSGTTPAIAGGSSIINTSIPDSNVRAISVLVQDPVNGLLAPLLSVVNLQYSYTFLSSVFTLNTTALSSSSLLSKPYKVLVTYRQ